MRVKHHIKMTLANACVERKLSNAGNFTKLGAVFGRTDFSRISIFGPPDFAADFLAGVFLLIFVGESAQKNPPGNPRQNPPKIAQQKSPTHFWRGGVGQDNVQIFADFFWLSLVLGTTAFQSCRFSQKVWTVQSLLSAILQVAIPKLLPALQAFERLGH